ncbi:MAG: N-acetyltransferase [Acidimicrobiia bacterium]|nr:N-acetyltransferase [Acidimicrobiia bacterium]
MSVAVRAARRADAEAIRAIYNAEVEGFNTFDLTPRTLDDQVGWIDAHSGGHPAVVAEAPGGATGAEPTVVGFGSLSPFRERPGYATTVEVSVYAHEAHRNRGVGRALLGELVGLARGYGYHCIIARVVGSNAPSIALHERCGFEQVGVEREVGRKYGRWLDVVELQLML